MAVLDTGEIIIHDGNFQQFLAPRDPNAQGTHGCIPRRTPNGYYAWAKPVDFGVIPVSEYEKRIADKEGAKAQLRDIVMRGGPGGGVLPARDQNGRGYCWQHSGVTCMMVWRAIMNLPYVDLSAYGPACRGKHFQDEGGWGAEGVDNLVNWGCPTSLKWPQQSTDRSLDNPDVWAEAAHYKVTEQWADLNAAQYDRKLTFEQVCTLNLSGYPTVDDYNFWSHSVAGLDVVSGRSYRNRTRSRDTGKLLQLYEFDLVWAMNHPITGGNARRIFNSWGMTWSDNGMGLLTGDKAIPDGCVGIRGITM